MLTFYLLCRCVEPITEAICISRVPFVHPDTSAFIVLRPLHIQDQFLFIAWVKHFLPIARVKELVCKPYVI